MEKEEARKKFAEIRSNWHARLRYDDKQKIFSHLRQIPAFSKAKTIMCYFSRGSEVPTKNLVLELLNSERRVVLPRTNIEDKSMTPYYISSLNDLEPASFGVMEPKLECKICDMKDINVVIVPAVSFDLSGNRLGYGLGFYDRFLPSIKCETIGLAYDETISSTLLPRESHDVPVNYVATERRILTFKKQ